jgi:PKD repeat protein
VGLLIAVATSATSRAINASCNVSPTQVNGTAWTAFNGTVLCGGTYTPTSLYIPSGATVYAQDGVPVVIEAATWIEIAGVLNADGAGGAGGAGCANANGLAGNTGGGTGGGPGGPQCVRGGGGGGGAGAGFGSQGGTGGTGDNQSGDYVFGGSAYDTGVSFSLPQPTGSGGGGGACGGGTTNAYGGYGGAGGGSISLIAPQIQIDSGAVLTADADGGSQGYGGGSGGGGSGGNILLIAPQAYSNAGTVRAIGGGGADGTSANADFQFGGGGGGGAGGRTKVAAPTSCAGGTFNVAGAGGGAAAGDLLASSTGGGSGQNGTNTCILLSQGTSLAPSASPGTIAAGGTTTISANPTPGNYTLVYAYNCGSGYSAATSATSSTCSWTTVGTHTVSVEAIAYNTVTLRNGTAPGGTVIFDLVETTTVVVVDVPSVSLSAPLTGSVGTPVTPITGSFSDVAGYSPQTWSWAYGDGLTGSASSTASTNTQSHTYDAPGTYSISLSVLDAHGVTGSATSSVSIAEVLPTVILGVVPSPINANASATFSATATSPSHSATTTGFTWSFTWGDGTTATTIAPTTNNGAGVTASHVYAGPGTYLWTVTARDKFGGLGSQSEMVTVLNPIPTVELGAMSTTVPVATPLLTTAYASSTWAPADAAGFTYVYAWGDGQTTTLTGGSPQSPSHVYESPGNYIIQLTVTDNTGISGSATLSVTVTEVLPTVVIGTPSPTPVVATMPSALPVMATSVSTVAMSAGFTYVLSWGDGSPNTTVPASASNGAVSASHTYAEPGMYTVTVTATDTFGGRGSASTQVPVADATPTVAFGAASYTGSAASPVTVTATAGSPVASQQSGNFTYAFSWGDGQTSMVASGAGVTTTHSYDAGGSYTISLIATDTLGTSSPAVTAPVTISNVAPSITAFTHPNGTIGAPVQFTVQVTDVSNADTNAGFTIAWDFGDGSGVLSGASLTSTTHQYTSPGMYTVTVTATDENGLQATQSATITVRDAAPVVSLGPAQSVPRNTPITLTPTLTPDNPAWTYTYAWTLGDGTMATTPTVTETFPALGMKAISVMVTDPYGGTGAASVAITVVDQPPVVTNVLVSPANAVAQQALTLSYTYADADGDAENGTTIFWYLNGQGQAGYNNQKTVPASAIQRNQSWYAVVTPKDGIAFGAPVTSNTVVIGDPAPQALNATITPANPKHADTLQLAYAYSGLYPESGTTICWSRNGTVQDTLANARSVPPPLVRGDVWVATVTPSDGTATGDPASTSVMIQDTAPVLGVLPDLSRTATGLTTSVSWTVSATDIDGDGLSFDCSTPQQDLGHGPAYTTAFPIGSTLVTCAVSDGTLTATGTFHVLVKDVPPTLSLTPSETVDPGNTTVTATAQDPFGRALTYAWTTVSGPAGLQPLGSATASTYSFSAFTAGSYVLQCVVSNGTGQAQAQTTVTVAQLAPKVNLGPGPRTMVVGETITLDGSHSVDPNGGTLTWQWKVVSGPVLLGSNTSATTTLTASAGGQGIVSLTANDGAQSTTAQLRIDVWTASAPAMPVASAGSAQTVLAGSTVTLDGSGSFDPNAQVLAYSWMLESGPQVTLSDPSAPRPTFVAPMSGTDVFLLTVTDSAGSSQSTVTITVTGAATDRSPTAVINPTDTTIAIGGMTTLQNQSLSPLAQPLTSTWTWLSGPYVTLTQDTHHNVAVTAYGSGDAVVQLVVNDGTIDSAPAVAQVHVTEGTMSGPAASVQGSTGGVAGTTLTLDGSRSTDPNGLSLVYQWTQLSGMPVVIHGSETAQASLTPPAPGTYSFELGVSDWIFAASTTVTVNVAKEDVPIAVVTASSQAYVGDAVTLDGRASHDPLGSPLTFTWKQLSGPAAMLTGMTSATPSFIPATNGTYVFQLEVSNSETTSAPVTATIAVQHFPQLRGGCAEAAGTGWLATLVLWAWVKGRRRRSSRQLTIVST